MTIRIKGKEYPVEATESKVIPYRVIHAEGYWSMIRMVNQPNVLFVDMGRKHSPVFREVTFGFRELENVSA